MWYKLKDDKPINGELLFLKLKDGSIISGSFDSETTKYEQANFKVERIHCGLCGEDFFEIDEEVVGWCYQRALEEMDKELDLIHECLTELYNHDNCTQIIKDCLDDIAKINHQ